MYHGRYIIVLTALMQAGYGYPSVYDKRFADNKSDEEMVFSHPMVSAQEQVGKLHQMDAEYERTLKKRSDPDEGALAEERDDGRSMYVLVPLDQLRKRDLNFTPPMEFDIDLKPMKSRTETLVDNRNEYVPSRTACHVVEPGAAPPMKPVSLKMTITNLLPPAEARGSKPLLMKNSSTVDSRGTLTVALDIKQCESSVQTPTMDETETGRERPCPPKLTEYPETLVENQGPAHLRKVQPEDVSATMSKDTTSEQRKLTSAEDSLVRLLMNLFGVRNSSSFRLPDVPPDQREKFKTLLHESVDMLI